MDSMNWSTNSSVSNDTMQFRIYLKEINDVLAVVVLMFIMLAMGTNIPFKVIHNHFRRPVGICIGLACQFVVMPLLGFTHIMALGIEGMYSVGLLLISCCPGGAVSNVFTYFVDGDVSLSVAMTSVSTLFALGFMPLNIWIYGRWIEVGTLVIPYKSIGTSLLFVTAPAVVGMLIKLKFPRIAVYITKVGSVLGFIIITITMILQNIAYPDALRLANTKLIIAVVTMPTIGFGLGYCAAWTLRQDEKIRRTIAIESSVQNAGVAVSVLALSGFSFENYGHIMLYPMMYAISMILLGFVLSIVYNIYVKCFSFKAKETENESHSQTKAEMGKAPENDGKIFVTSL